MKVLTKFLLMIMFFLNVVVCSAQTIKGKVTDENKSPVEFANIVLLNENDSAFICGTVSNNDGGFILKAQPNKHYIVKVSLIGYVTVYKTCQANDVVTFCLNRQTNTLKGVVINGNLPVFRQYNGALITNVDGSLLSKKSSMKELFASIPGIIKTGTGAIEVFGAGAPVYYINNRKVSDNSEVESLDPKNIKTIELITNPGAQYDAEGKAIVKITTKKNENGYNVFLKSNISQNDVFGNDESVNVSYTSNKLNISALYDYWDDAYKLHQPEIRDLYSNNDIYSRITDQKGSDRAIRNGWNVSMDYQISKKQVLSIKWNGYIDNEKENRYTNMDYMKNSVLLQHSDISNNYHNPIRMQHLNGFYSIDWNKMLSTCFIADYVRNSNKYHQNVAESTSDSITKTTSRDYSSFNIYAAKQITDYKINPDQELSFGTEYNQVSGKGNLNSDVSIIPASDYRERESKFALFMEYHFDNKKWSFMPGVRYEFYHSGYKDRIDNSNSISRTYNNLFPSLVMGYHNKLWSHSLSLSSRITRPTFRQLSNNSYYNGGYSYQLGNPSLKPAIDYSAQWQSSYRFVNLSLAYEYDKNITLNNMYESADEPQVIISTYDNFNHIHYLRFNLNVQKKIDLWNPVLSVGLSQPFFKTTFLGKEINHNKAKFYVSADQYFTLPAKYNFEINYYYCTGGNLGIITIKPYQELNLSLTKSFINDRLDVSL